MATLTIDQKLCVRCGSCVANYPDLFTFSNGGADVIVADEADFSGVDTEAVKKICPANAIVDGGDAEKSPLLPDADTTGEVL